MRERARIGRSAGLCVCGFTPDNSFRCDLLSAMQAPGPCQYKHKAGEFFHDVAEKAIMRMGMRRTARTERMARSGKAGKMAVSTSQAKRPEALGLFSVKMYNNESPAMARLLRAASLTRPPSVCFKHAETKGSVAAVPSLQE